MLLMLEASITWAIGTELGAGNLEFSGPQMALAYGLHAIALGPKNSRFLGLNPLPLALVMDTARIKSITQGTV